MRCALELQRNDDEYFCDNSDFNLPSQHQIRLRYSFLIPHQLTISISCWVFIRFIFALQSYREFMVTVTHLHTFQSLE